MAIGVGGGGGFGGGGGGVVPDMSKSKTMEANVTITWLFKSCQIWHAEDVFFKHPSYQSDSHRKNINLLKCQMIKFIRVCRGNYITGRNVMNKFNV